MKIKLILQLWALFYLIPAVQAQKSVEIIDDATFKHREECPQIVKLKQHQLVSKIQFKDRFIYTTHYGKFKKEHGLYIVDLNTCEERKGSVENALPYSIFFRGLSPDEKLALMYSYGKSEYSIYNQDGKMLWQFKWDLKDGEVPLEVISAKIDNEGNTYFFVIANRYSKNPSYGFIYKAVNNDNFKMIGYRLDVNGRATFKTDFDQTGNIHFMGTYDRKGANSGDETKRGVFHGKVNPKENDKIETILYPFDDLKKYDSSWDLLDYRMDDNGNTTLCAIGQYLKSGAGRDYSKVFMIQIDNMGNVNWSHLINTINLRENSSHLQEGKFFKIGKKYAFIYFDNEKYIIYDKGIDIDKVSSEVPRNDLQMFVVDEEGKLSKHRIASIKETGKVFPTTTELEDVLYLSYKNGKKQIQ